MARFFIVTTCLNADEFLDGTISCVVEQHTNSTIYYHVQDAGSTDQSLEILEQWASRASEGQLPSNVHFTYSSEADRGMYDGIEKAFERFSLQDEDWMTWINAGDHLFRDAVETISKVDSFGEVSWVCGRRNVFSGDPENVKSLRQLYTSSLIRQGLARPRHLDFLQQEGLFWRCKLWRHRPLDFSQFKLAGDFHLWSALAEHQNIWCIDRDLGAFRVHEGQLSEARRDEYLQECGSESLAVYRSKAAQALKEGLELSKIEEVPGGRFRVTAKNDHAFSRQVENKMYSIKPTRTNGLVALDSSWQFPAITELHAYRALRAQQVNTPGVIYLAFPWATLIDCLQNRNLAKADYLIKALEECARLIEKNEYVITVCQHILLEKYLHILDIASVDEVFWSHAHKGAAIPGYIFFTIPIVSGSAIRGRRRGERYSFLFRGRQG